MNEHHLRYPCKLVVTINVDLWVPPTIALTGLWMGVVCIKKCDGAVRNSENEKIRRQQCRKQAMACAEER